MPFITSNGIEMYYEDHGAGTPVVLLHGGVGNHMSWWQQLPVLTPSYRVITFDHRGFGLSGTDDRGPEAYVDDLEGVLDGLGVDDMALVGQSLGAFTAAGFASRHPKRVKALVMSSSNAGLVPPQPPEVIAKLKSRLPQRYEDVAKMLVHLDAFPQRHPALCVLYEQIGSFNQRVRPSEIAEMQGIHHDIEPIVKAGIPVLMLNGEDDRHVNASMEIVAAQLPGCRLVTVPDAGHLLYFERADVFNEHLVSFLAEHV